MFKVLLSGCCGKMGTVISNLVNEFPNLEIVAMWHMINFQKKWVIKYSLHLTM